MSTEHTPQTWFITGTSTGFGRLFTEQLLARGDRVAATLRTPAALDDLAAQYGDQLWVRALDVTDTQQLRDVVDAAFTDLGRIDVIVSNAGYGQFAAAEELGDDQITALIDTNVIGSVQLARAVTPHLRAQGGGTIIQLSSMAGLVGFPGMSLYNLSKWAIEGFYEAFSAEVAPFGIQTMVVEPGGVAGTAFVSSLASQPTTIDAYTDGSVGQTRAAMANGSTSEQMPSDPTKTVAAMIDAADAATSPSRLLLGPETYDIVTGALQARLAAFEAQKDITMSTGA